MPARIPLKHPITPGSYLVVFFCTLYSFSIIADNLPKSLLKQDIQLITRPVNEALGVWQRWDMFQGGQVDLRARYKLTYSDGTIAYRSTAITNRVQFLPTIYSDTDYSAFSQQDTAHAKALAQYQCTKIGERGEQLPLTVAVEKAVMVVPRLSVSPLGENPSTAVHQFSQITEASCVN